jgi:preprotein translocase subunit SecG
MNELSIYLIGFTLFLNFEGAPQLKSAGRNLNFMQYHSWDVIAVYFILITAIVFIIKAILLAMIRACRDHIPCRRTDLSHGLISRESKKKIN